MEDTFRDCLVVTNVLYGGPVRCFSYDSDGNCTEVVEDNDCGPVRDMVRDDLLRAFQRGNGG